MRLISSQSSRLQIKQCISRKFMDFTRMSASYRICRNIKLWNTPNRYILSNENICLIYSHIYIFKRFRHLRHTLNRDTSIIIGNCKNSKLRIDILPYGFSTNAYFATFDNNAVSVKYCMRFKWYVTHILSWFWNADICAMNSWHNTNIYMVYFTIVK